MSVRATAVVASVALLAAVAQCRVLGMPASEVTRHAMGAAATNQSIEYRSCTNSSECGGKQCETFNFTSGECYASGFMYTCVNTFDQCLDMTEFNSTDPTKCDYKDLLETASAICDFCYMIPGKNGNPAQHGIIRDCRQPEKRAFHYECDPSCQNCNKQSLLPIEQCTADPWTNKTLIAHSVHPCGKIVAFKVWPNNDCTGNYTTSSAVAANFCSMESSGGSFQFNC